MLVFLHFKRIYWTILVIVHNHFSNSSSFFRSVIILNVRMGVYIFVFAHHFKALIDNFSISFSIDHVSDLVSFKGMFFSPLDNSCGSVICDMLFDLL